jgi:hypothetical protein
MFTLAFPDGEPPREGRQVNEWRDEDGSIFARGFSFGEVHWIDCIGLGIFAFSSRSSEVRVWPKSGTDHKVLLNTFHRILDAIVRQALGAQTLHASAVVGPTGALAFCGKKGSGKSTLAFGMHHHAGWRQIADDALVLRIDHDRITACPLPFRPRLRPTALAYFTGVDGPQSSTLDAEVPLTAIFVLHQNPGLAGSGISLIWPVQAFSTVLAHAHCFDAENQAQKRRLASDYMALVDRVPVFALEYRPDLQKLPQLASSISEAAARISAGRISSFELQPAPLLP